jgi:purine nucleosidase
VTVKRVALDTDIGTDVDDLLALLTVLGSPELELVAVTTVYGDTVHRARIAAKALRLAGASHVPVVPGLGAPASGRAVWWAGHEGRLFGDVTGETIGEGRDAADLIAAAPAVIGIGPLTNVAAALRHPHSGPHDVVLMGGDFASGAAEHNLRSDAASAHAVLASDARVQVVGLEQTQRVEVRREFADDLARRGGLGALVAAEVAQYQDFSGRPSVPHDVVAVLLCAAPQLFTLTRGRVTVVPAGPDEGRTGIVPDPAGPHSIVTDFDPREILHEMEVRILRVVEGHP